MIKGIIFDLDDTLILELDYISSGYSVIADFLERILDKNSFELKRKMMDLHNSGSRAVFNDLLDYYNFDYDVQFIQKLIDLYKNHIPSIKLCKDSKDIIRYLYQNEYKLGLITDGYHVGQRNKISALSLEQYFDVIIVTDELGSDYWKPDPRSFHIMSKKMGLDYSEMIYVGDNPAKDFYIGSITDLKTVRIVREQGVHKDNSYYNDHSEDYLICSLLQLVDLLEEDI